MPAGGWRGLLSLRWLLGTVVQCALPRMLQDMRTQQTQVASGGSHGLSLSSGPSEHSPASGGRTSGRHSPRM